jgi:hypothetical protein
VSHSYFLPYKKFAVRLFLFFSFLTLLADRESYPVDEVTGVLLKYVKVKIGYTKL